MKSIGEKIADGIQKFYTAFINQRVLTTPEEVQANTNEKNLASAVVVGEIYNNLMFPDGTGFYPDTKDGVHGYNTDAARGADTFYPFNISNIKALHVGNPINVTLSCDAMIGQQYIIVVVALANWWEGGNLKY